LKGALNLAVAEPVPLTPPCLFTTVQTIFEVGTSVPFILSQRSALSIEFEVLAKLT
jgi:hypothetical protein